MAWDQEHLVSNDVILTAVREDAVNKLVQEGVGSAYTSAVHKTGKGIQVDTTNTRDHKSTSMLVKGSANHDSHGFSETTTGNFTIDHNDGKPSEKDNIVLTSSKWDDIYRDSPAKFNLKMSRTDQSGNNIQTFEPAKSEETSALDPSGAPVQIAKPIGDGQNVQPNNITNPDDRRMEAEFIIHDKKLGDLSYNEQRELKPDGSGRYHGIIRDKNGKVYGIVDESFKTDYEGNIIDVQTSSHLQKPKK
ncbi:MAG TPA: hypothetical protein V6C81_11350 [Planktothrix sp.]|jgi:hypothetical protein